MKIFFVQFFCVFSRGRSGGLSRAAIHGVAKSRTRLSDWSDLIWCVLPPSCPLPTHSHIYFQVNKCLPLASWERMYGGKFWWLCKTENIFFFFYLVWNELEILYIYIFYIPISSVQSPSRVRLFATSWIAACQASLSITNSRSSLRLTSIESVMPSRHLILCRPLLLLPPIPPSIRVFSNESTLRMRWPKYWSFNLSIIPSKEIPGLISFRMDWLDLLAVCMNSLKSNRNYKRC